MNEYRIIENQTKKKLIDIDRTMADLAREIGVSQQLLYRYFKGKVKKVTPAVLKTITNKAIERWR